MKRSGAPLVSVGVSGALLDVGGALADSRTIMPMFIGALTSSALAVGAIETIRGVGFFLPQLWVAHRARRRPYRKPLYIEAAAIRAASLAVLGAVVASSVLADRPQALLVTVFVLWSAFCLAVGAAQVPYADVFARVVPADRRSRLLGGRGLVGGALGVLAGLAVRQHLLAAGSTAPSFATVFVAAAIVFAASAAIFSVIAEPPVPIAPGPAPLRALLSDNVAAIRTDRRFRLFLVSQILDAAVLSALPFYVVQAARMDALPTADVGLLVAVHTIGAVGLNPLWGFWGDRKGKLSLLRVAAPLALVAPVGAIVVGALPGLAAGSARAVYLAIFFVNGACASARVVGDLGYLMEISPDDRRAEYSGFLNTWLAPVRLLPVLVAFFEPWISLTGIFAVSLVAALSRMASLSVLRSVDIASSPAGGAAEVQP